MKGEGLRIYRSYKTYLRVIELSDRISSESKGGPCRRAALGLKMVSSLLVLFPELKGIP
jgi:hypothetical protein